MKSFRFLFALCFASMLALSAARAVDDKDKPKDKPAEKVCDCMKDNKEGKTSCATVDKACCCTGEKAKPEKKEDKPETKK